MVGAGLVAAVVGSPGSVAAASELDPAQKVLSATIFPAGGAKPTVSTVTIGDLETNRCPDYGGQPPELHAPSGNYPPQAIDTNNTWSLFVVLTCGLGRTDIPTGVTVHQGDTHPEANHSSLLTMDDLVRPALHFQGGAEPLITSLGSIIVYYRPWRGGNDYNAGDKVEQSPIAVDVTEGPPIGVTAAASPPIVAAGAPVTFSADLQGASGNVIYDWDFDGGAHDLTSILATPREVFPTAGTYNVTLQVHDGAGGGGVAQVPITVTGPGPTTPPPANAPATGPAQSSGLTPGGIAGKQIPKQGVPAKRPGVRPTGKAAKPSTARKAVPTRTVPTTTARPATPPVEPATRALSPASPAVPPPVPVTARHHRAGGSTGRSRLVDGLLISALAPRPIDSSPLVSTVAPVRDTAPAARRPVHAPVATGLAATFAVFLLLSLGAGHQLRWRRHPDIVLAGS